MAKLPRRAVVPGLILLGLLVGGAALTLLVRSIQAQTPQPGTAEVLTVSGTVYACGDLRGCTTPAAKGATLTVKGEVRTGPGGKTDLQSRTTLFRLQNNATLQFQEVTNAFLRMLLKAGRIFAGHEGGKDVVSVDAGSSHVEAIDTLFSVELRGDEVYVAVPAGWGSVTLTLAGGATGTLGAGQAITFAQDARTLPAPRPLAFAEQAQWDVVIDEWLSTPGVVPQFAVRGFPETGHEAGNFFLAYWNRHGQLPPMGFPISEPFTAPSVLNPGQTLLVQCFERGLMEIHPEYAHTPFYVELAQLGSYRYRTRYGLLGALNQQPNQTSGASRYFEATGHWVGAPFLHYWETHGGIELLGYPISDEFQEPSGLDQGRIYRVQYFERALLEYHPEYAGTDQEVLAAQLGTYHCIPGLDATATTTVTASATATDTPTPSATGTSTVTPTPIPPRPGPTHPPPGTPATVTPPPSATPSPNPTSPPGCAANGTWHFVPSANTGSNANVLRAVTVLGITNIWAVGNVSPGAAGANDPLTMHWNGANWTVVPFPAGVGLGGILHSVVGLATNDVWAVGEADNGGGFFPWIGHWDGVAWTQQIVNSVNGSLFAVSAVAPNDIWAVGAENTPNGTLTMHWDGTTWTRIASPDPPGATAITLRGVSARAANDVWAVGFYDAGGDTVTLAAHWDGVAWTIVTSPATDNINQFYAVSAVAANDVWAVGTHGVSAGDQTLIAHWNGVAWAVVPSPSPGSSNNILYSVTALSATNIWAVGSNTLSGQVRALIAHWDGTSWIVAADPSPPITSVLYGTAQRGVADVWSVGTYTQGLAPRTLTEWYCGP